jgi:hypothetical protein
LDLIGNEFRRVGGFFLRVYGIGKKDGLWQGVDPVSGFHFGRGIGLCPDEHFPHLVIAQHGTGLEECFLRESADTQKEE